MFMNTLLKIASSPFAGFVRPAVLKNTQGGPRSILGSFSNRRASVVVLHNIRSPPAVLRAVLSIVVSSVDSESTTIAVLERPDTEGFEVVAPFVTDEDTSCTVVFVLRMRLSVATGLHAHPGEVEKPIVSLELPIPFRIPLSRLHFGTPCLGQQFRLLPPFFQFAFAQPHFFR